MPFSILKFFRQSAVELVMKPADEICTLNAEIRLLFQPCAHQLLHRDMRTGQMLVGAIDIINRKIVPKCPLNFSWEGFVALNQVGVITVHFMHQRRDALT